MTPRSRATVTGRIKEPQTLSSLVSRWGHRLLVAHRRNSVFSELRQSLLDRIHSAIRSTPSSILRFCNPSDEGWHPSDEGWHPSDEGCSYELYCIVSIHLYSASCSAHQSEALQFNF